MKTCQRCGAPRSKTAQVCPECGFAFADEVRPLSAGEATSMKDAPLLAFLFGCLGLAIPLFLFSVLAIIFSRKPYEPRRKPFRDLGLVFGIVGLVISLLAVALIIAIRR